MAAPIKKLTGRWGGKLRGQDFSIQQGEDYTLEFTVSDKDLTGAGARWILAKSSASNAALVSKTVGVGVTIPVGTDGVVNVALDDTDTNDIDGTFHHELEVTDSSGAVQIVSIGCILVAASIFWSIGPAALLGIAGPADDPFGMVIEDTFEVL